ncbi:DUF3263 domain-containing protein [Gordonia liuliyuniae]|uniref:DUF3263 domain-containing protein n=1 Tax=Gordonia liuliyuniae TaxID=2911517 RepID=A0ABS9IWA1_9ACTN|nr:DUF3263 domain-containing protein [Gordonia liuliyuniae]MCF8589849.1 DUF3263 domain-containing protein [Gordonia liuliyuniae]
MNSSATPPQGDEEKPSDARLSDEDRAIIDLSKRHYRTADAHAAAVRTELGLSVTDYFRKLNRLADDPAAFAYSPIVVKRLRRNKLH